MFRLPQPTLRTARVLAISLLATLAALAVSGTSAEPPRSDVIVVLNGSLITAPMPSAVHETQVHTAVDAVLADVDGAELTYRYQAVPAFAGSLPDNEINELRTDPRVTAVIPDAVGHGADSESGPLIHLGQAQALGFDGEGVTIGVIDSGINSSHPDFAGAVVYQECFMAGPGLSSRCPNGNSHQKGTGAAKDDLGHGSNVAGIVAGRGNASAIGVAPAASLEIFKVLDKSNTFYLSDLYAAIDEILANHPEIDVLNMSLGTFSENTPAACTNDPFFDPLREAGIISFVSSMNQRFKAGMGYPACVDSIVSVGAVYDSNMDSFNGFSCSDSPVVADQVACWSNSDPTLDLLAPGCQIAAPSGFSNGSAAYCGTSQASPHAAGAAALLLQQHHNATPDVIESLLKNTGVLRTDPANSVSTPRIDVLAAVSLAVFGDVSCDFHVDGFDIASVLSYAASGLEAAIGACPAVGSGLGASVVGDVTCDDIIDTRDALKMLLYYANLDLPITDNCPSIGDFLT